MAAAAGRTSAEDLEALYDEAVADTLRRFEATGSPVITDGEQRKPSFATYPIAGLDSLAQGGVTIPFADGHTRQLPVITSGPFRYAANAWEILRPGPSEDDTAAQAGRDLRVGAQPAVPAGGPARLSPRGLRRGSRGVSGGRDPGMPGTRRDHRSDRLHRSPPLAQARSVGRPAWMFVDLNNQVLDSLSEDERRRVGVHTCPGGDQNSTHSADVDYAELLPGLLPDERRRLLRPAGQRDRSGAGPPDPWRTGDGRPADLRRGRRPDRPAGRVAGGGPRPRSSRPPGSSRPDRLGTTDDCGFSPFGDDTSTSRDTAFAKIRARVEGTEPGLARAGTLTFGRPVAARRKCRVPFHFRRSSSVVEQGTHKPLVGGSNPPSATSPGHPRMVPADRAFVVFPPLTRNTAA